MACDQLPVENGSVHVCNQAKVYRHYIVFAVQTCYFLHVFAPSDLIFCEIVSIIWVKLANSYIFTPRGFLNYVSESFGLHKLELKCRSIEFSCLCQVDGHHQTSSSLLWWQVVEKLGFPLHFQAEFVWERNYLQLWCALFPLIHAKQSQIPI